ncbi:unnamed protein product [Paramecium pentaurelia]|uniref:Uncharacterized protein n=1 Tax=Paramecium pentaurelia TaxID=43138 RepID=A0A8S1VZK0_9CILI|nr:unnamed protein product [Paramecium pentaurelia]
MNRQFQQNCPFRQQYAGQYDFLTKSENTLCKGKVKLIQQSPSFADYVNALKDQGQKKNHRHNTETIQKCPILPKIEVVLPDLQTMKSHFVLSLNKSTTHSYHSQSYIQHSNSQTPRSRIGIPTSITRRSLPPQKQTKLSTITPKSSLCIKSNFDEDDGIFLTKIGGEEVIQEIARLFHQHSQIHPIIQKIDDPAMYESKFGTFLEYIMGKPVFFNIEALKQKHIPLKIDHALYNQFKSYLISSFIQSNKGPPELIFEFSALIEQYKYCIITSEQTFAQIYNQRTENNKDETPQSIVHLADLTYQKILDDQTLCEYFVGIQMDEQAKKLGIILHQMMGWNCGVDYVLNYLRKSHQRMNLTNVHFTLFKQHLVEAMKELGLKESQIELITKRMDGYRSCIVNQDCLLDFYFQSPTLFKVQVKKYEVFLQRDPRFRNFPNVPTLLRHAHFLLKFITHQHQPLLTKIDLTTLHKNCVIQNEWLDGFRDNFFILIKNYNLDRLILQDYADLWFQLRFIVTNQQSIESIIGPQGLDQVQFKVQLNLQDNEIYSDHFRNAEYQLKSHVKKIVGFIFRNSSIYKANDLRVIHSPLKISEQTFNLFVQLIKQVMQEEKLCANLILFADQICQYYRSSICNL